MRLNRAQGGSAVAVDAVAQLIQDLAMVKHVCALGSRVNIAFLIISNVTLFPCDFAVVLLLEPKVGRAKSPKVQKHMNLQLW